VPSPLVRPPPRVTPASRDLPAHFEEGKDPQRNRCVLDPSLDHRLPVRDQALPCKLAPEADKSFKLPLHIRQELLPRLNAPAGRSARAKASRIATWTVSRLPGRSVGSVMAAPEFKVSTMCAAPA